MHKKKLLETLKYVIYIRNNTVLPIYLKGLANLHNLVRQFSTTEFVHLFTMFCWYN